MALVKKISVEVAYATPQSQKIVVVQTDDDATISEVIHQSGILQLFADIDLSTQAVGVFSKQKKLTDKVRDGDRIEIYRPLTIDPKEARKDRVKKLRKKKR